MKLENTPTAISLENVSFHYPNHYLDEQAYLNFIAEKIEKITDKTNDKYLEKDMAIIKKIIKDEQNNNRVLNNVSLKIEPGRITALVGKNGAGKTTITHLLQHHFEPDSGQVLLNKKNIFEYNSDQLIRQFSWLRQQPFILDRYSFKDNLLLGVDRSRKRLSTDIKEVLAKLELNQLVGKLPNKEFTILGEESHLSGGERQLLAIARALLQNRPFIIFDEGSSQLDSEKEFKVLSILQELKKTAAILFITHRMSVARKADYIYVIDQGRVAEEGKHQDLLNKKGIYKKFWKMQVLD